MTRSIGGHRRHTAPVLLSRGCSISNQCLHLEPTCLVDRRPQTAHTPTAVPAFVQVAALTLDCQGRQLAVWCRPAPSMCSVAASSSCRHLSCRHLGLGYDRLVAYSSRLLVGCITCSTSQNSPQSMSRTWSCLLQVCVGGAILCTQWLYCVD